MIPLPLPPLGLPRLLSNSAGFSAARRTPQIIPGRGRGRRARKFEYFCKSARGARIDRAMAYRAYHVVIIDARAAT